MQRWLWQNDPRLYQTTVLALLLLYGIVRLDFAVSLPYAAAILATVLLTQAVCTRLWQVPAFDPRSALISGLSLCLLLRTNVIWYAVVTAVITIASKFVLRWRGKHLFNPTNFGLVLMLLLCGDRVWVSSGQWGSAALAAFFFVCLGGMVVYRAQRSDVTYAFLGCYVALQVGRALWLGDPLTIPLHRLQNGAFLLFSFFMISDPKTTPDSRSGRVLFAALVALAAGYLQFYLYWGNALLWALAGSSMAVPLIDALLPGSRYGWQRAILPARLAAQRVTRSATAAAAKASAAPADRC
jgi:Na+-transporting NADH:ubiquinone oxidoreductase subunit NqrB